MDLEISLASFDSISEVNMVSCLNIDYRPNNLHIAIYRDKALNNGTISTSNQPIRSN